MNPADRASVTHCPLARFINPTRRSLSQTPVANARHWLMRLLGAYWTESTPERDPLFLLANNKLLKRGKLLHQHQENRDGALLLYIKVISGGK